jgi:hypothetical protein
MQLVQRLQEIPVAVRIIISGTPIQNNLMEMHALFDFACEVQSLAAVASVQSMNTCRMMCEHLHPSMQCHLLLLFRILLLSFCSLLL